MLDPVSIYAAILTLCCTNVAAFVVGFFFAATLAAKGAEK